MQGIIDRFEGEFAIIEVDGKLINIKKDILPQQAREGDVMVFEGKKWSIDINATANLQREIQRIAKELWEQEEADL